MKFPIVRYAWTVLECSTSTQDVGFARIQVPRISTRFGIIANLVNNR